MAHRRGITNLITRSLCVAGSLGALGLTGNNTPGAAAENTLVHSGPAAQELLVEETYRRQCRACHGEEGRGDGRSARRYNPRPPDFQDPAGVVVLSEDELLLVIAEGRAGMPSFEEVLSAESLAAMVAYVRVLSGQTEEPPGESDPRDERNR